MLCAWDLTSEPWYNVEKIIGTQLTHSSVKSTLGVCQASWTYPVYTHM